MVYEDKVLGRIERRYDDIEDFVIVRSNGKPLYLLCNVVDDIRDRITHIIRGQDHMTNTTRQVLLYEALGAPVPVFAHMPLTLDLQKRKISKRSHGEIVAVQFYRDHGFIPWALCNFLVLLGWNPGTDQEIFSREELIEAFTLERISKVNSVFNYRKDDPKFFTDPKAISINSHYLRTMPIEEIVATAAIGSRAWDSPRETGRVSLASYVLRPATKVVADDPTKRLRVNDPVFFRTEGADWKQIGYVTRVDSRADGQSSHVVLV